MRKLIILLAFSVSVTKAQLPSMSFVSSLPGAATPYAITTDSSGNSYVTGMIFGLIDFDPSANTHTLSSSGQAIFVAKYNSGGQYQWAFQLGDNGFQTFGYNIKYLNGFIYLLAKFSDSLDVDPSANTNYFSTHSGGSSVLLAKYDINGQFIWSNGIGGPNSGNIYGNLGIDNSGNLYVAGGFQNTADFNPSTNNTDTLKALTSMDAFLAKYNSSGQFQWVHQIGGSGSTIARGISIDGTGNLNIIASFNGTVDIDPSAALVNVVQTNTAGCNFIAKYDLNGQYVSHFKICGKIVTNAIAADYGGNVFLGGNVWDVSYVDPANGNYTITSVNPNTTCDAFIAKYNNIGQLQWINTMGDATDQQILAVDVNETGSVLVTGKFEGTMDLDPSAATATVYSYPGTPVGVRDFFIARYNSSGQYQWGFNSKSTVRADGLTVSSRGGNLAVAGTYSGAVDFDPSSNTTTLPTVACMYVAKYADIDLGIRESLSAKSPNLIYPNPTNGDISLYIEKNSNVELYDITGRLLYKEYFTGNFFKYSLQSYAAGIYLLKLNEQKTELIIKQ